MCKCNYWNPYAELCGWMDGWMESPCPCEGFLLLWSLLGRAQAYSSWQLKWELLGHSCEQLVKDVFSPPFAFFPPLLFETKSQAPGSPEESSSSSGLRYSWTSSKVATAQCVHIPAAGWRAKDPTQPCRKHSQGARDYLDQANKKIFPWQQ